MSGYITAKQRWVADRQFKAGQPLKYRRTIGGLSKDYVLIAKYTDAIPEMWPAWFENMYPNTWFLPSNIVNTTQIWSGDTIVDFSTGQRYINNTNDVKYAGELLSKDRVYINGSRAAIFNTVEDKVIQFSPFYNPNYEETEWLGFWEKDNGHNYDANLYEIVGTQRFILKVTGTYPLIWSTSKNYHTMTFNFTNYTTVNFTGILPDSSNATSAIYRLANEIAEHIIEITNNSGTLTIHRYA